MIFKVWNRKEKFKKPLRFDEPRKKRSALDGVNPKLKEIALYRLAVLRGWQGRLSKPRKPKSKNEVTREFLEELNSGILWPNPDGVAKPVQHIGRATLYNWQNACRKGGFAALVPRYKVKDSSGKAIYQPLRVPFEMKFPGSPKRNGKKFFLERLKRRWKRPPLEGPILLTIFFDMPVPKGTRMTRRMKMLKHKIAHTAKPNIDALQAFIIDCLTGIVFRHHSQIIEIHSRKEYRWWPQIKILIRQR